MLSRQTENGLIVPWMGATFAQSEGNRQGLLQIAFTKVWMAKGAPFAAIMYSAKRSSEVRCFFSPGAVAIARPLLLSFGAEECPEPNIGDLRVLVNISGRPSSD